MAGEEAQIDEGAVQLRFADEAGTIHDLNAAEFAEVLQGLAEFTGQMARAGLFGDGPPPEVRVRPAEPGSFVITAILTWAVANPEAAFGMAGSTTTGLVVALRAMTKRMRALPADVEHFANGMVKIKWSDNTVSEVPESVWTEMNKMKRASKRTMRKLLAPLSDEADRLEIRNAQPGSDTEATLSVAPDVVVDRSDYRIAAHEEDDTVEQINTFTVEAQLSAIDFRPGEKWRVRTPVGNRQAIIDDDEFLRSLDDDEMALHKNDVFEVEVREVATTRNGRTTRDWTLTKVTRKRRGGDDDDTPAVRPDAT